MRTLWIGAATAALLASPAWADSGYLGASVTHVEADVGALSGDGEMIGIDGTGAFLLRDRLTFQLDAALTDSDNFDDSQAIGMHLTTGEEDYRVGGFVGFADLGDSDLFAVGAEGATYFGRFTVSGTLAYFDSDDLAGDGFGGGVAGRYFVNRNLRFDAGLNVVNLNSDLPAGDLDAVTFGLGGEFRFPENPLSVFARYAHVEVDDIDADSDAFTFGLRYNFDASLVQRDEDRASTFGLQDLAGVL